jgi:glycosyltransferase involved in cell wall biosynthesis
MYVANARRSYQAAARWVFRSAKHVTACSNYLAERAIHLGVSRERVHFLPYGVDSTLFRARDSGTAINPFPVVLAVGRLVEKKGFRILVDCANGFLDTHPEAELWIAGEGDDRSALEEAISRKPPGLAERIKLIGRVEWPRIPELMRQASVCVVPSINDTRGNQDGLPNVVMEAMSCGAVVVATDIGGASAVIESGATGFIVPAGDGARLAEAISMVLSNIEMRDRVGAAASAMIRSRHTWHIVAEQLETMFRA